MFCEKQFIEDFSHQMEKKYHYPKESIHKNKKLNGRCIDLCVQKGNMIIQAFEFKVGLSDSQIKKLPLKSLQDSISMVSFGTPFYVVSVDKDGKDWEIYSTTDNGYKKVDKESVLNYNKAISRFLGIVENATHLDVRNLRIACHILAALMLIYITLYVLSDCCIIELPLMPSPLSIPFIIYISIIDFLVILPFLVQLMKYLRKLKLSFFEVELNEKLNSKK